LLAAVENLFFPMMPIWTFMLARWGFGIVYGLGLIVALVLVFVRLGGLGDVRQILSRE
jgi:hypothetical protein